MLIDFENIGYVKCDNILLPTESSYIPASTWGFIKGDITEQKDLIDLITNLEIGLTPEQIQMLSNAEIRLDNLENILETLDTETITNTLNGVKIELNRKAYKDEVYTKSEIDNKGYLTEHQSLADYYNKSEVEDLINNIEINGVDLSSYATKQWVEDKNYLTEHQSLADYYNKSEIDNIVNNIDVDLTGYATEQFVVNQGYLTEHQSLVDYAKKQWVLDNYYLKGDIDELLNDTKDDTKDWVTEQGYLAESTLLTDYYTKEEIDDAFNSLEIGLTPEQIEIINNLDGVISGFETDIAELTDELNNKANSEDLSNYVDWETYDIEREDIFSQISTVIIDVNDLSEIPVEDVYHQYDKNIVIKNGSKYYKVLQGYTIGSGFMENYNIVICDFSNSNIIYKISSKDGVSEIDLSSNNVDLTGYATEQWVEDKGYLTEHQSLTNYYNKSETDNLLSNKLDTNLIWSGTQAEWDNLSTEQQASYIIAMIEL